MRNKTYHVTKAGHGWKIKAEGAQRASAVCETKEQAVARATDLARGQEPAQVMIHKANGLFQEERTYGPDPCPPKG